MFSRCGAGSVAELFALLGEVGALAAVCWLGSGDDVMKPLGCCRSVMDCKSQCTALKTIRRDRKPYETKAANSVYLTLNVAMGTTFGHPADAQFAVVRLLLSEGDRRAYKLEAIPFRSQWCPG